MLNFFKRLLGQDAVSASNPLELSFLKYSQDESKQRDFLQVLMQSRLIVLGKFDEKGKAQFMISDHGGKKFVNVYSSESALKLVMKISNEKLPFIEMNAVDLMPLVLQYTDGFVLNEGLEIARSFTQDEIEQMPGVMKVVAGTKIKVGLPENTPSGLLERLAELVKKTASLNDIYFGMQEVNEKFTYILVVDTTDESAENTEAIVKEIKARLMGINLDRALDIALVNPMYREAFKEGGLLSSKG